MALLSCKNGRERKFKHTVGFSEGLSVSVLSLNGLLSVLCQPALDLFNLAGVSYLPQECRCSFSSFTGVSKMDGGLT